MSMAKIFTDAACRKLAPGAKRRRIRDAGARSLFLIVEFSGHKAWQMRFRRPDGRPGKITLGPFDLTGLEIAGDPQIGQPLTLQAARQLAATVHRDRALGRDVVADHKARRHRRRHEIEERAASTFAASVPAYIDEYARPELGDGGRRRSTSVCAMPATPRPRRRRTVSFSAGAIVRSAPSTRTTSGR